MKSIAVVVLGAWLGACAAPAPRAEREEGAIPRIESLDQLRAAFNEHSQRRRVVALASPT